MYNTTEGKEIREQKARDVRDLFFKFLKSNCKVSDAFRAVEKSPAPRFYITYENARRIVSLMERGKPVDAYLRGNKLAQYEDLFRIYQESYACVKNKSRRNRFMILNEIILRPAPSFYISKAGLDHYIYRQKKRK